MLNAAQFCCSLGRRRARNLASYVFRSLGFSVAKPERICCRLLQAAVIGGQVCRVSPISTDEWAGGNEITFPWKKSVRCGHNKQCLPWRKRVREKRLDGQCQGRIWLALQSRQKRVLPCHASHVQSQWLVCWKLRGKTDRRETRSEFVDVYQGGLFAMGDSPWKSSDSTKGTRKQSIGFVQTVKTLLSIAGHPHSGDIGLQFLTFRALCNGRMLWFSAPEFVLDPEQEMNGWEFGE